MNRQGDHLDFTLEHMFPALLAEAQGIGGDHLMFATNALLGGIALLGFYLLARRVLRNPLAALGAVLCLGVLMPQVAFSRDSTTEVPDASAAVRRIVAALRPSHAETLGHRVRGRALRRAHPTDSHRRSQVLIIGLPFVGLCAWWQAERSERRRIATALLFVAAGVAIGIALGWFDLVRASSHYLLTLRVDVRRLQLAALASLVAALVVGFVVSTKSAAGERVRGGVRRARGVLAIGASVCVFLAGFLAWLVRPRVQTVRVGYNGVVALVQKATHLPPDPTRRYFEHAVVWASWYIGPITLTLAIVGAAYATRAFVRGTLPTPSRVTALVLGPPTLLYLWRPSITPDQIWATRRFVPAVLPILVLAAFGVLYVLAARRDSFVRFGSLEVRRVVAVALGVARDRVSLLRDPSCVAQNQQRGFPTCGCRRVSHRRPARGRSSCRRNR